VKTKKNFILLTNNSSKTIYADWSIYYPDTSSINTIPIYYDWNKILPNDEFGLMGIRHSTWKSTFEYHKIDTLMIYIFDEEVLKNNTWGNVIRYYLVLQRYDLSLQDLEKLNWKIYYPPTEAMKDIKMFPPYKEEGYDD